VRRLRVQLGTYDRSLTPRQEVRRVNRKVDRVYVHNEHEGNSFDIAILKLNESVIYNAAIRPICFPEDIGTLGATHFLKYEWEHFCS
jgi:hypothetical protein